MENKQQYIVINISIKHGLAEDKFFEIQYKLLKWMVHNFVRREN